MKNPVLRFLMFGGLLALPACSSLTLEGVDFGWPVESVLTVTDNNTVNEGHYAVAFQVGKLATEEFQDSTALRGAKLRVLRSTEGYYFVTGPRFKNVYVFRPGRGELAKESVIEVSPKGMQNPALNQRPPYVELVDGEGFTRLLSRNDIVEGGKK